MAVTRALHLVLKLDPKTLVKLVSSTELPLFEAKIAEAGQERNETLPAQF